MKFKPVYGLWIENGWLPPEGATCAVAIFEFIFDPSGAEP